MSESKRQGKARKQDKNVEEHLRGEIRGLKAEVKKLKQQLKYHERRAHSYTKEKDDVVDDVQYENFEELCPECGKGKLQEHIVAGRYWQSCDTCKYRTKAQKC